MKTFVRKFAAILIPLLLPLLENLVNEAIKEIKKKLQDDLIAESAIIRNQLRSLSDISSNS